MIQGEVYAMKTSKIILLLVMVVLGVLALNSFVLAAEALINGGGSIIDGQIQTQPGITGITPAGFNSHDYQKLVAFARQEDNRTKLGWNFADPGNWVGITWDGSAEKRVKEILIAGKGLEGKLDVSNLTALKKLNCPGSNLTSIDVTGCNALDYLDCGGNNLTKLDVSGHAELRMLYCASNNLTSLDLTGCSQLVLLTCPANNLTALDVSDCNALGKIQCGENPDLELIWGLSSIISDPDFDIESDLSDRMFLENEQEVRDVINKIDALPAVGQLDPEDERQVLAAKEAYDGLSLVQRAFVSNNDKLVAAVDKITELKFSTTVGDSDSTDSSESNTLPGSNEEPDISDISDSSIIIKLTIDQVQYSVNGQVQFMDAAPIIIKGRTMLPLRCVVENLGGSVVWNANEKKATASLQGKTVSVWVGSAMAEVEGRKTMIDPGNPSVMPVIVPPGRTLLPLRFMVENLGCRVDWEPSTKTVTIYYSASQ